MPLTRELPDGILGIPPLFPGSSCPSESVGMTGNGAFEARANSCPETCYVGWKFRRIICPIAPLCDLQPSAGAYPALPWRRKEWGARGFVQGQERLRYKT
jgi:hypothetical protein